MIKFYITFSFLVLFSFTSAKASSPVKNKLPEVIQLADQLSKKNNTANQRALYNKAIVWSKNAETKILATISFSHLCAALVEQGKTETALSYFSYVRKIQPLPKGVDNTVKQTLISAYIAAARALMSNGHMQKAQPFLEDILNRMRTDKSDTAYVGVIFYKSLNELKLNKLAQAQASVTKGQALLKKMPNSDFVEWIFLVNQAILHIRNQKMTEADKSIGQLKALSLRAKIVEADIQHLVLNSLKARLSKKPKDCLPLVRQAKALEKSKKNLRIPDNMITLEEILCHFENKDFKSAQAANLKMNTSKYSEKLKSDFVKIFIEAKLNNSNKEKVKASFKSLQKNLGEFDFFPLELSRFVANL